MLESNLTVVSEPRNYIQNIRKCGYSMNKHIASGKIPLPSSTIIPTLTPEGELKTPTIQHFGAWTI